MKHSEFGGMFNEATESRNIRLAKSPRARSAMSLVEVMVVVTLTSILLVSATALIVQLQQWDRRVRDSGVRIDQSVRLAEAIRSDVQRATKTAATSKNMLTIHLAKMQETRYTLDRDLCRREVIVNGRTTTAETFTIGPSAGWNVEAGPPGRRPAYAISLKRAAAEKATSHALPLFVYAVQGSDLVD